MFACDLHRDHLTAEGAFYCMVGRGTWWTILEVEPNKRAGVDAKIVTIHAAIGVGGHPDQAKAVEELEATVVPEVRILDRAFINLATKALRDNEDMDVRVALLS